MIEPISVYFEHCERDWQVPEERTRNSILLFVTSGAVAYRADGRIFELTRGDLLYLPEGAVRSAAHPAGSAHDMYAAHFRFPDAGDLFPRLRRREEAAFRIKTYQYEYVKQRFSLLTQHWLRKHPYSAAHCHSIVLELLAIALEEAEFGAAPNKTSAVVSQLQNHIAMNYRRTIPMSELAQLVERTPNYISRLFKEATGATITEYTQQIRIAAACDLLANSQMNVGEVSDFLGFCEPSYFNKVFKKQTGTLPSTYLKEQVKLWRQER